MRRTVFQGTLLALLLLATGMGAVGCQPAEGETTSEEAPETKGRSVRVTTVDRADIERHLIYGAELKASTEVRLYSTLMDRIISFPWQDGDEIEKDAVVALIRREGFDHGLDQITAELRSLDVTIRNVESELRRARELLARGVITEQSFDALRANLDATRARRRAIVAGRGQLASQADNAVVRAPFTGVLSGKMLEEGDIASPQMPLGRLMVMDPLEIELKLMEADVGLVAVGQTVYLELDAHAGRTFEGTLIRIQPFLNPQSRTNAAVVTVQNPRDPDTGERLLKPGMYGRARLVVSRREGVVVVPESALLLDSRLIATSEPGEDRRRAFVVDASDIAHERVVRLGQRDGNRFEVLEGLEAGERLVILGQHGLKDAQPVQIREEARR
jgi:RND family efflux transporter MFP subunit